MATLQLCNDAKSIIPPAGASISGGKHIDNSRTAIGKRFGFLQYGNGFFRLTFDDESESKLPKHLYIVGPYRKHATQFAYRIVVPTCVKQDPRERASRIPNSIELAATLRPVHCLGRPAVTFQPKCKTSICVCITRVQFKRLAILSLGLGPAPLFLRRVGKQV